MDKSLYKHVFTRGGMYLGCRKVTMSDYIRPYLWIGILVLICVGSLFFFLKNQAGIVSYSVNRPMIEVRSK